MKIEDFLEKLVEEAKIFGWDGDYIEISAFVKAVHLKYGIEVPDLEPYPYDDEDNLICTK